MCLLSFRKRVDSDGIRVEKFNRFINGIRIRKRYYELRILTKWRRFLKFLRNRRNPPRETRVSLRILGHVYFSFFFILHDHRTKSLSKALYFCLVLLLIEEEEGRRRRRRKVLTVWHRVAGHQEINAGCPCTVSNQRHVPRIAAEVADVLLHPMERRDLIHQTVIRWRA